MGGEGTCWGTKKEDKNGKERQLMNGELSTRYHTAQLKLNPAGGILEVCVKWTRDGQGRWDILVCT